MRDEILFIKAFGFAYFRYGWQFRHSHHCARSACTLSADEISDRAFSLTPRNTAISSISSCQYIDDDLRRTQTDSRRRFVSHTNRTPHHTSAMANPIHRPSQAPAQFISSRNGAIIIGRINPRIHQTASTASSSLAALRTRPRCRPCAATARRAGWRLVGVRRGPQPAPTTG